VVVLNALTPHDDEEPDMTATAADITTAILATTPAPW